MCDVHTVHPNPTHQTPNTKHQTPNTKPGPKTQNPKPKTQNPKPKTQNLKPKTQNPKPQTTNHKPQTCSYRQLDAEDQGRLWASYGIFAFTIAMSGCFGIVTWVLNMLSLQKECVTLVLLCIFVAFCACCLSLPHCIFSNILRMFDLNFNRSLEKSFNSSTFTLLSSESNQ
jgi:hypothetical protein